MPRVSIVLPTFNGSKYIAESLTSIINQTFTDWELIVVNDCSTDNTLNIINEFSLKDNRIKVFTNKTNLKLPASLNEGFKHASGMYYTWTSDDNRYKANALEEMVKILDVNPELGLLYCNMDIINEAGEVIASSNTVSPPRNIVNYNVVGACFMYRANIAKKIGGYEPDFFLAEDYEYWLRFFFNSNIDGCNLNLYEYRQHDKSLTLSSRGQQILLQRARVKYKYITQFFDNIFDLVTIHGLYCELVCNGIALTKKDINLFKSKDKNIRRWFKAFVFYKNHKHIGTFLYKKFNFELPDGIFDFINLPESSLMKVTNIVKKAVKCILPYGFVRIIQKIERH